MQRNPEAGLMESLEALFLKITQTLNWIMQSKAWFLRKKMKTNPVAGLMESLEPRAVKNLTNQNWIMQPRTWFLKACLMEFLETKMMFNQDGTKQAKMVLNQYWAM